MKSGNAPRLVVAMYHYVRDLPRTPFPRIKGMLVDDFSRQVDSLRERFEIASLEAALAFLDGTYHPRRDLCLLTFDDGLRDHYQNVLPVLVERGLSGLFFLISACAEEGRVVAVHKNHFLMAALDFDEYQRAFLDRVRRTRPDLPLDVDPTVAQQNYRWDTADVAAFKFLLNFRIPVEVRSQVLDELFPEYLGSEEAFARSLYLNWEEAREMQRAGMVLGGHTHRHLALATLSSADQQQEIETNTRLLRERLTDQQVWPFSYPYGKPEEAFTEATAQMVAGAGYACAFSTEVGANLAGQNRYRICRFDTKDLVS